MMLLINCQTSKLQGLSTEDYKRVMKVVEQAILSTDMALYFRKKNLFLEAANRGEIDWQEDGKKERKASLSKETVQHCKDVSFISSSLWDANDSL